MTRSDEKPAGAQLITSYQEFRSVAQAFADGKLSFVVVVGGSGLQKSRIFDEVCGAAAYRISGNATAFEIYCELFAHQNQLVVLDDVDGLHATPQGICLLKQLCQTDSRKRVSWNSNAVKLAKEGIPRQFVTTSHVAIITNGWRTISKNVEALEDRGHVISFEPAALEVHARTAEWFWDQEVFDFVAEHLHLIATPSMRDYVKGAQQKKGGLNWRNALLSKWGLADARLLVAQLMADPSYETEKQRAQAFVAKGGGCRATYFNHARKVKAPIAVPPIAVKGRPPLDSETQLDLMSLLQKRYGKLGKG